MLNVLKSIFWVLVGRDYHYCVDCWKNHERLERAYHYWHWKQHYSVCENCQKRELI